MSEIKVPENKVQAKHQLFAERWVTHWNARRAYTEAGFIAKNDLVARVKGCELLTNSNVRKYIKKEWRKRSLEYSDYKQMLISDCIDRLTLPIDEIAEFGERKVLEGGKTIYLNRLRFKNSEEIPPEVLKYVESIKETRNGFEVKLTSRDKALENLARLTGAFEPDKIDLGESPIMVFPPKQGGGHEENKD